MQAQRDVDVSAVRILFAYSLQHALCNMELFYLYFLHEFADVIRILCKILDFPINVLCIHVYNFHIFNELCVSH